jgi:hypothetical protein
MLKYLQERKSEVYLRKFNQWFVLHSLCVNARKFAEETLQNLLNGLS